MVQFITVNSTPKFPPVLEELIGFKVRLEMSLRSIFFRDDRLNRSMFKLSVEQSETVMLLRTLGIPQEVSERSQL